MSKTRSSRPCCSITYGTEGMAYLQASPAPSSLIGSRALQGGIKRQGGRQTGRQGEGKASTSAPVSLSPCLPVWVSLLLRGGHLGEHVVDQAELLRLLGVEVAVALGLDLDGIQRLAGVLGQDLVEPPLLAEDLLHFDLHVGGLPVHPLAPRL